MNPKLNTQTSIVDLLKSMGQDSSYSNREKLAKQYGIDNYGGSADQNVQLMGLVNGGKTNPAPTTTPKSDTGYTGEVSAQLKDEYDTPTTKTTSPDDEYKTNRDKYQTDMDKAFKKMKGIQTETYNKEYEAKGLGEKKAQITNLDNQIAQAKAMRDEALNKLRTNPGLSSAQMTGQAKKIADFQNATINNLIEQRNGVAGEYNSTLDEIDKIVSRTAGDALTEYEYYSGLYGKANDQLTEYQKTLREQLKDEQGQSNWERELAQALEIAQMKSDDSGSSSINLQLVKDSVGAPTGTFNPRTGEYEQYPQSAGSGSKDLKTILLDKFGADGLAKKAKDAGYSTGGFFGMGKKGDVESYINAIKAGTIPSPLTPVN